MQPNNFYIPAAPKHIEIILSRLLADGMNLIRSCHTSFWHNLSSIFFHQSSRT